MTALTQAELEKRFKSSAIGAVQIQDAAYAINEFVPDGHAKQQALLKLEEAMMWVEKAVSCEDKI